MPDSSPTPAAERQRAYRARKRDGARIMRGDLSSEAELEYDLPTGCYKPFRKVVI